MSAPSASPPADAGEGIRWLRLLMALTALTAVVFLFRAFGASHGYIIQDDARQFQAWMARIANPAAMPGNLIADYWQSVSPWLYRTIFRVLSYVGVDPLVAARLIPVPLLFATAWLAWRVASRLSPQPFIAFCMATAVMISAVHQDAVFTGSPRGFMAPLFLLLLDGLLGDRKLRALVGLFLLAALYPAPALVGLTVLGLSRIRWSPRLHVDFSAKSVLFVLAAVLLVAAAILPFRAATSRWEPILTLSEARTLPNLMTPRARNAIAGDEGQIGWVCSSRTGFLPQVFKCRTNLGWATPVNFLLLVVPPLLLFGRALRRARRGEEDDDRPGALIFGYVFAAAVIWYLIAAFVAFKLHLPSRYSQRVLDIAGALALGQLAGHQMLQWAHRTSLDGKSGRVRAALGTGLAVVGVMFAAATTHLRRPADPDAMTRLKATPLDTRIAGVSLDLDFVPALAGRSVLAATEHAIPYHFGYFVHLRAGLRESVEAATTSDPIRLARFLASRRIDIFMIDRSILAGGLVPPRYASLLADPNSITLRHPRSALARLAPRCTIYAGPAIALIDGRCLLKAATMSGMPAQPPK